MNNATVSEKLKNLLLAQEKYQAENVDVEKVLNKTLVSVRAQEYNAELLTLLQSDEEIKKHFFVKVKKAEIFKLEHFLAFINNRSFLPDSFTAFKNKIGLATDKDHYLADGRAVVLNWPYKDCILEGGQNKEDQKRSEVFFNEVLAPDQINRLLDDKVFVHWKRYDKSGTHEVSELKDNDNLIIKGNNLVVLHSLKRRFAGKVKLIYIDPPYNTGSDSFGYNDRFNHSTWLTFMKNRLEIARELLSDDGVMFVHCDDNEQAYLKVLLDELFNRENFVGTLIHQRAKGGGNAKYIVKGHDYILVYALQLSYKHQFIREKVIQKKLIEIDGKQYIKDDDVVRKVFGKYDKSLGDRRCFYEELEQYKTPKQIKEINQKIKTGEYVLESFGENKQVICTYTPIEESYSKIYSIVNAMSENGTNHIEGMGLSFSNPKPEEIIRFVIQSCTQRGDIILDFHLGSGTTAAVAHKMGRQYIGIEQMDYIETISLVRMKKVIAGEQGGISESVNWQGGGSFVYCELANDAEEFRKEVKKAKADELPKLLEKAKNSSFLSYRVDRKQLHDVDVRTEAEQRKLLLELVDANTLYINYTDLESEDYNIDKYDQKLNRQFYSEP